MPKKRVVAFGTFDLLHPGHLYYLEHAAKLGNELVVVVARDATAKKVKGAKPINDELHRLKLVSALKPVVKAVLGGKHHTHGIVARLRPDVIALGYDQKADTHLLKSYLAGFGIKPRIVRIGAFMPKRLKCSRIKKRIIAHK